MSDVLQWLVLVLGAMVAGAMVLEFLAILPALRSLQSGTAVEVVKQLSPRAWRYLPVCGTIATLSAVAVLIVEDAIDGPRTILMIAALVCIAVFLVLSAGLYRREDLRVRGWPTGDLHEDWAGAHARLRRLHIGRMACFLIAYGLLAGVIVSV